MFVNFDRRNECYIKYTPELPDGFQTYQEQKFQFIYFCVKCDRFFVKGCRCKIATLGEYIY